MTPDVIERIQKQMGLLVAYSEEWLVLLAKLSNENWDFVRALQLEAMSPDEVAILPNGQSVVFSGDWNNSSFEFNGELGRDRLVPANAYLKVLPAEDSVEDGA